MSFLFGETGAAWTNSGTCTISVASPAVVTFANAFAAQQPVQFTTTGTLPTGLSPSTTYYVSATGLTSSSFQVSATVGGAVINTTGAGSGTHTCTATTASSDGLGTSGEGSLSKAYALASAATINGIWFNIASFTSGQLMVAGLYDSSNNLLAQSAQQTISATGWTYFPLSSAYSAAAGSYKFGIVTDNVAGHHVVGVGQLGGGIYQGGNAGTNAAFVSSFPTLLAVCTATVNGQQQIEIYADGGSSGTPLQLLNPNSGLALLGRH